MQINNQLQLRAILREKRQERLQKQLEARQIKAMSFMMIMGSLLIVASIIKG